MDFQPAARAQDLLAQVETFYTAKLLPRHREWVSTVLHRREPAPASAEPLVAPLKAMARAQGLWNLGLPDLQPHEPGTRLSNLEFAPIAEVLGRLPWVSEIFNCHAPDVPNMIMLQRWADPQQRQRWLAPLLEGTTRSCFGLTEPAVASSDATNIATRIERSGQSYRINGHKWYITGAAHPQCSFMILVGVTDPQADRTRRHSAVIVPMDTPGVKVTRTLRFLGWDDHVAPIGEVTLENVEVPVANLLGEEGAGFKGAQVRLGPARLHHCMRCLGLAEVLVGLMVARAAGRRTFGRAIIEYDTVQNWIAQARVEIEQARLMLHKCAWLLDARGFDEAWREVSIVKVIVPTLLQTIADRTIQVFGAMGGSDDTPMHHAFAMARLLRIADGPDEVHLRQIFRTEPRPQWTIEDSPYLMPGPQ